MTTARLDKIIDEVRKLTPEDRRRLLEHLEQYEEFDGPQDENIKYDRLLDQVGEPTFEFLEDGANDSRRKDDR